MKRRFRFPFGVVEVFSLRGKYKAMGWLYSTEVWSIADSAAGGKTWNFALSECARRLRRLDQMWQEQSQSVEVKVSK